MSPKNPFIPFREYCLRTPSLKIGFLEGLFSSVTIDSSLKETLKIPFIKEALYLASPEFYKQTELWASDAIKDNKKANRIKYTLLKYLTRMSTRCTPFGLFAGCSIGEIGAKTLLNVKDNIFIDKDTRFDMHFLVALAQAFSKREVIKRQLKYYPNSTIYRLGDRYRYVEYTYENKKRVHSIESVAYSEYLEELLAKAALGTTFNELLAYLKNEGFDENESENFINELIENQILINELAPTVTGKDFLKVLSDKISVLEVAYEEQTIVDNLVRFQEQLSQGNLQNLEVYHEVAAFISTLKVDFEPKYLFQTDAYPEFDENELSGGIIRKVQLGLRVLNKISSSEKNVNLERFKKEFNKRYEHQSVPLLELMDIESGLGYGNTQVQATPFLDDIKIPVKATKHTQPLTPFQELLFEKLQKNAQKERLHIEITDNDLEKFTEDWEDAPETLSVLTEIVETQQGQKIIMDVAGANAARLLARFALGNKAIGELVARIVSKEKELQPKVLLAEIVHIPESRTGNILRRPHLRTYEIPCLGFSDLPKRQQIALSNILVSVKGDAIVLRCKVTGKRIVPKLSNAHNFNANPLPVYKFLCDVQYQNVSGYYFSWGSFLNEMLFLPRVTYKDIIFAKARWIIKDKDLKDLKVCFQEGNKIQKTTAWKEALRMPNKVELVEGDNTLLIDFASDWSVNLLYNSIKNRKEFTLQEVLSEEMPIVKSETGCYKNEFVFSFYHSNPSLN